jgi:hypothetical protein
MDKIFGANWRTGASGYVETVCVIIIGLCVLPASVWENPKVWIPASALLIAKTVKDTLTKDKNVTGGTVPQTPEAEVRVDAPVIKERKVFK